MIQVFNVCMFDQSTITQGESFVNLEALKKAGMLQCFEKTYRNSWGNRKSIASSVPGKDTEEHFEVHVGGEDGSISSVGGKRAQLTM